MKDERKIQQMGNAFTIYLPTKWLSANSLSKGSAVQIMESPDGSLVISGKRGPEGKRARIVATEPESALHSVISAYVSGAGEILLTGSNASTVAFEAHARLGGVEIVAESREGYLLKVFVNSGDVSQRDLLRRMHNVTLGMASLVAESLLGAASPNMGELERMEDSVDRLFLMTLRVAYASRGSFDSISNAAVGRSIERACDHIFEAGLLCKSIPKPERKTVDRCLSDSCSIYRKSFEHFWSGLSPQAIFSERKAFTAGVKRLQDSMKGHDSLRAIDHIIRIADYSNDMAEITGDLLSYKSLHDSVD